MEEARTDEDRMKGKLKKKTGEEMKKKGRKGEEMKSK